MPQNGKEHFSNGVCHPKLPVSQRKENNLLPVVGSLNIFSSFWPFWKIGL